MSEAGMSEAGVGDGALATIARWRAQGAHRVDPVRLRFIEALAARTAAQQGAARALLDERLAQAMAAYAQQVERVLPSAATAAAPPRPRRGPLGELVDRLAQQPVPAGRAAPAPANADAPAELKAVRYFRSTWSKLSADQRLTQSLAKLPDNPGPLNSQHLVHRSLLLMREQSPDYLNHFIAHVDALIALERLLDTGRGRS